MLRLALICFCLAASQAHAQQQAPLPSEPDSVALAFARALSQHDFSAAAALVYPASLSELQDDLVIVAGAAPDEERARWMTGVESAQAVAALPPGEAFAHHMNRLLDIMPHLGQAFRAYNPRLIGTMVKSDTAYVVLGVQATEMSTVLEDAHAPRLLRSDRGWRVLLPARLRGLAANLAGKRRE
jgi:hypothetical protein